MSTPEKQSSSWESIINSTIRDYMDGHVQELERQREVMKRITPPFVDKPTSFEERPRVTIRMWFSKDYGYRIIKWSTRKTYRLSAGGTCSKWKNKLGRFKSRKLAMAAAAEHRAAEIIGQKKAMSEWKPSPGIRFFCK
jgi:hypothetical protein